MAAGLVALIAALQMVNSALGAQAQIGVDTGQMDLASLVCGVLPFLGFVGAALARKRRLSGRLLVSIGGFGTCAAAAVAVWLSGPNQNTFLPLGEGASPSAVALSAIVASVAALVMIVASAIDLRTR